MKFNTKTFKVLLAFVIIIGTVIWAVNTVLPRSYEGTSLNFGVGSGTVSLTNSSEQAIPIQLISSASRSFKITSSIDGVSGSSARQGSGSNSTHLFEFELPSGTFEFTVERGTNITLVASNQLEATVNPANQDTINLILVVTLIVVSGALYYASNATQHAWIGLLRNQFTSSKDIANDDTAQAPAIVDTAQGQNMRSFGDNRSK